jgi:hypothetical protein
MTHKEFHELYQYFMKLQEREETPQSFLLFSQKFGSMIGEVEPPPFFDSSKIPMQLIVDFARRRDAQFEDALEFVWFLTRQGMPYEEVKKWLEEE